MSSNPPPPALARREAPAATLAEYPASPASRRAALVLVAASGGMFLALWPFAAEPLGVAPWFIPMNQSVLIVNDLITASLLFGYVRRSRQRATLVLACGYLYSATMAGIHMLTFPGVFAPTGLLGAGPQTTGYLHVFWHIGFPVAVMGYVGLRQRKRPIADLRLAVAAALGATLLAAGLLAVLATAGAGLLPPMLAGQTYSSTFNVGRYGQWAVVAVALAVLVRKRSDSALELWLSVVLTAFFFEIPLVSIVNAGRWDVGFYAGRVYALVASGVVLVMLLSEHSRINRELAIVDEKTRSANALRESREVLRLALQSGRMGVFSVDVATRKVWWSPELEHLVGLSPGSLRPSGDAFIERVYPDDRLFVRRSIRQAANSQCEFALEFRLFDAKGELRWCAARGEALRDERGLPVSLVGVVADITERKHGEDVAHEMEAYFRTLADEIPQLAWMARPDGWIYWYNQRWYQYTGTQLQDMEGWGWQKVHDPAVLGQVLERWGRSLSSGEPFEMVFPIRGADGTFKPFLTRMRPLKNAEGQVLNWFGTNTDISAQRDAEDALRMADQRKDEFLATLAHELRNPLAPIRNAVSLMGRIASMPANLERARSIIDRQSQHLARLVDDLLEVSRITQGKVTLQRRRVSLADCLSDALNAVEPALQAAGHQVALSLPEDPLYAFADATRVVQCFVNLLNNAIRFTPQGGRVSVSAAREGGWARIAIADSGIGIVPQDQGNIFRLFSQVTPARERSQGGLGIGLSLVKGFVELHGATVGASSAGLGHGSEFTIRLPLQEAAMVSAPGESRQPPERPAVRPRRVLVVDDNLDAAASMTALLQAAGHDVREAHDGAQALVIAFEFTPEVVLLDIGLPGMNGLAVARELRKRMPEQDPLLIIAVTGWGQESDRRLTREAGFDFHLTKPVNVAELDVLLSVDPLPAGTPRGIPAMRH